MATVLVASELSDRDGHHAGHIVAVVLLDGQEVVVLRQEVEHGLDVAGHVVQESTIFAAQQHAGSRLLSLLISSISAHGLHEVVAQHLHLVPGGRRAVGTGPEREGEEEGAGEPACPSCLQ